MRVPGKLAGPQWQGVCREALTRSGSLDQTCQLNTICMSTPRVLICRCGVAHRALTATAASWGMPATIMQEQCTTCAILCVIICVVSCRCGLSVGLPVTPALFLLVLTEPCTNGDCQTSSGERRMCSRAASTGKWQDQKRAHRHSCIWDCMQDTLLAEAFQACGDAVAISC